MRTAHRNVCVACIATASLLAACNGILDDIYDTAPDDSTIREGFNPTGTPGRYTIYLNATAYDSWIYIDFDNLNTETIKIPTELTGDWDGRSGWTYHEVRGSVYTQLSSRPTDAMPEPESWDIAIHHFDVRTNAGSVLMTPYASIDDLPAPSRIVGEYTPDKWGTTQVITDLAGMLSYHIGYQNSWHNPVLTTWATMDFTTPPPVYSSTGKVYMLKMADGRMAAIHLLNYMSAKGTKGYLTIDLKLYQ